MQHQLTLEVLVTPDDRRRALREDVRAGLSGPVKQLPPTWFYDEAGSRLFDEITRLPEYYPTRTERSILAERAADIAAAVDADTLVEIGSGTSEKTRLLLDAMARHGSLQRIVLFDISEEVLHEAASILASRYGVAVHAVVGDLRQHLSAVPEAGERRLWAFLGSTIGNFTAVQREGLLGEFRSAMGAGDHFLLGTDLVKERARLVAAYDDGAGVTAAFNRNVLRVINRELGANFDPDAFAHRAAWNDEDRHIEMRLGARGCQTVKVAELAMELDFADGEEILTEISAKFTTDQVRRELGDAGLVTRSGWTDEGDDFLLTLARPGSGAGSG